MADKDEKTFRSRATELSEARIRKQTSYSAEEMRYHAELAALGRQIEALRKQEAAMDVAEYAAEVKYLENKIREKTSRNAQLATPRFEQATAEFRKGMSTYLGARYTGEAISDVKRASKYVGARATVAAMPTTEIEARLEEERTILNRQTQRMLEAKESLRPGQSDRHILAMDRERSRMIQEVGIYESALDKQRRLGTHVEKRHERFEELAGRAGRKFAEQTWRDEARTGGAGSAANIQGQLNAAYVEMVRAAKDFDKAVKEGAKNINELGKSADQAAENVEKLEMQLGEASRMPGGGAGGKWGARLAVAGQVLEHSGAITMAGANVYRHWGIQQALDTSRLGAGFANLATERFRDSQAAASGDMAAVLRLQRGTWEKSIGFGSKYATREVGAEVASTVGSGMTAGGRLIAGGLAGLTAGAVAGSFFGGVGAVPGAVIGAGIGMVGGALSSASGAMEQTSEKAARLQSGAVRSEAFLNAQRLKFEEDMARQAMDAAVLQRTMNYTRQSWRATTGAGGARANILDKMRDPTYLDSLAKQYSLGIEETAGLTAAGLGTMGRQFKATDVERAGQFARAGLGTSEQYMTLRGQMSQTGGSERDLGTILRNAVALGMDASKNVNDMVRTMSGIAAASSAGGISTFGGAAARTAAAIEAAGLSGIPENMRAGTVANLADQINQALNQRKIDIPSLIQSSKMFNQLGLRAGTPEGEAAAKMKPDQAQALFNEIDTISRQPLTEAEKTKRINQEIGRRGLSGLVGKDVDDTKKRIQMQNQMNLVKSVQAVSQSFAWDHGEGKKLEDYAVRWKDLTADEKVDAQRIWATYAAAVSGAPSDFGTFITYGETSIQASERGISSGAVGRNFLTDPLRGKGEISSGMGYRIDPKTGKKAYHSGIDIKAPTGTGIFSGFEGTVLKVGTDSGKKDKKGYGFGLGNYITVLGWDGKERTYGHMEKPPELAVGDLVYPTTQLGAVGNTGKSTGSHLHYQVRDAATKKYENPLTQPGSIPSQDTGFGAEIAEATRQVTEYTRGLETVNGNLAGIVDTMQKEAENLDPKTFKAAVDASAGRLDGSISALAKTIDALNMRAQGKTAESANLLQQVNKDLQSLNPGGVK